jgi:UPF0755 protein
VSPAAKKKTRAKKRAPKSDEVRSDAENATNLLRWTGIAFLLLLAVTIFGLYIAYPRSHGPGAGNSAHIDVQTTDPDELSEQLGSAGLIASPRVFAWYMRLTGASRSVVLGPHYLSDNLTPGELLRRLERRGGEHTKIVIPEGWTRFDIANRLDAARVCPLRSFLTATEDRDLLTELKVPFDPDRPSAEGFLFPATYELELDSEPREVVRRMVRQFDKRYAALEEKHDSGLKDLEDSLHWGKREIVTLASMVEKEAAVDDERPIIASVFLNRLRDPSFSPRKLQCDPTSAYGCFLGVAPSCVNFTGKITREINLDPENTYSTYVHEGLPPGPISNPGAKSIEAVMSPALTHYFYFVAKGGGRHTFSETLGAHNAAVHGEGPQP